MALLVVYTANSRINCDECIKQPANWYLLSEEENKIIGRLCDKDLKDRGYKLNYSVVAWAVQYGGQDELPKV